MVHNENKAYTILHPILFIWLGLWNNTSSERYDNFDWSCSYSYAVVGMRDGMDIGDWISNLKSQFLYHNLMVSPGFSFIFLNSLSEEFLRFI